VSCEGRRRNLVWGVTWLAYAAYYLGRKGFSAAKHSLKSAGLLDTAALGAIDTAYLAAYSLGQFASGVLGDRVGARRLIGYGLLASAALCAAFGSLSAALALGVVFTLNGLVQASGWPGTTRAMAEWTTPENRGTVMGLWSTCYQVGPFLAGPFMGMLIVRYGWRSAFHVPALIMAVVALVVLWLVAPGPRPVASTNEPMTLADEEATRRAAQRAVVRSPLLWSFSASYFFIKFTRYALALWLPFYLSEQLGYDAAKSNAVASAFEGGGMFGVIALGALSDRLRVGRVLLSAISLLCLAGALFAGAKLVGRSTTLNVVLLALIGAFLFAPDSILCGAAAQDAGGRHAAAMATGFVNGVGSVGAFLEGLSVPLLAKRFGWQALFPCLVGMAVLSAVSLLPALTSRSRSA
jgi:OPA family sugar phosphate sensor protein UhpC-like MFS transporter